MPLTAIEAKIATGINLDIWVRRSSATSQGGDYQAGLALHRRAEANVSNGELSTRVSEDDMGGGEREDYTWKSWISHGMTVDQNRKWDGTVQRQSRAIATD